jgi:tetratricopeptide (TPR) repeat protein
MSIDSISSNQTTSQADTMAQGAEAADVVSVDGRVEGYLDGGDYKEVIKLLREYETRVSLTEQQFRYLAHAYISEGKAQDALAILDQIKTFTPYGGRLVGWCHLNLGNWDDALRSFEKSLEQENDPRNHYGICLSLLRDRCALELNYDEHPRMLEILEVAVAQEECFPECFGWLDDIRWVRRHRSGAF